MNIESRRIITLISLLVMLNPHTTFAIDLLPEEAQIPGGTMDRQDSEPAPTQLSPVNLKSGLDTEAPGADAVGTNTQELLASLVKEVKLRQTKVIVDKAVDLATKSPRKATVRGARTIYSFRENDIYEISVSPGMVTDVALDPGEILTSAPQSGDIIGWSVMPIQSGGGAGAPSQTHLIIKALDPEIETNLIVATDRRTYHMRLRSGDLHMPSVSFVFQESAQITDDFKSYEKRNRAQKDSSDSGIKVKNTDYEIRGRDVSWKPILAYDDGKKVYIRMPQDLSVMEAPTLYAINEEDELEQVNYRLKDNEYVVERLFARAELRAGKGSAVRIISKSRYRPGFFERLFD